MYVNVPGNVATKHYYQATKDNNKKATINYILHRIYCESCVHINRVSSNL